jgi:salicylate hydroxylase
VDRYSWGREASVQHLIDTFADFCPPIQQLHGLVTSLQQFDYFAGPRLETVISLDAVALIGDASHPLSGAFGAGAGFALEDAFVLGAAIDWAVGADGTLADALHLFDDVRSPHYKELYGVLDLLGKSNEDLAKLQLPPDEEIRSRVGSTWKAEHNWMYDYEVSSLPSGVEG